MMLQLLLVSAVAMGMAHTITRERIFRGLRERCGGEERWLGYLVSCPYCASHWLAFVLVPLTATYPLHMAQRVPWISPVVDWFLSSILVTVLAAFLRVLFFFVDEAQALVRRRKRLADHDVTERDAADEPRVH
jgi:hypothetical protein